MFSLSRAKRMTMVGGKRAKCTQEVLLEIQKKKKKERSLEFPFPSFERIA